MEAEITHVIEEYDLIYVKIQDINSLNNIHGLLCEGKRFEPVTSDELFYCGKYYEKIEKNDELSAYYLLKATLQGNMDALCCVYFDNSYFKLAKARLLIEKEHSWGHSYMAQYYKDKKQYDLMKEHFLKGIEKGQIVAMNDYAVYLENQEDFEQMEKYYLMAIDAGNTKSMKNFASYLREQEDYTRMMKYYKMSIRSQETQKLVLSYYKQISEIDDFSFLEINFTMNEAFIDLLNVKFDQSIDLPTQYHQAFCKLKLSQMQGIRPIVKQKQFILQLTGIFPIQGLEQYIIEFQTVLSLMGSRMCVFPSDVMKKIAGSLFL